MLNWVQPFNIFCFLDNRQYNFEKPAFECLLAAGCKRSIQPAASECFESLSKFYGEQKDWLFGHLAYDLKNETEQLDSANFDGINFPDCHFFIPDIVIQLNEREATIFCEGGAGKIFDEIEQHNSSNELRKSVPLKIQQRITPEEYINTVRKIQEHILRGDCYELNFCQEFFATDAVIDPLAVYTSLVAVSPNPFSALYRLNDRFCICASPERYFKIDNGKIYSQPIKGTAKRNLENSGQDELGRLQLINSEKEKSENVMVVDLVRNDLSKICKQGSVNVDELFGIYSFPQVHQMISTISGELESGLNWIDAVKATFPMGSMTGAPKKRVMEIIERYEKTRRGLFSGAIGYIKPNGDADFNVVIRSILYNATDKYVSFQAGGAITFYSDAQAEYNESLLKVATIRQLLEN